MHPLAHSLGLSAQQLLDRIAKAHPKLDTQALEMALGLVQQDQASLELGLEMTAIFLDISFDIDLIVAAIVFFAVKKLDSNPWHQKLSPAVNKLMADVEHIQPLEEIYYFAHPAKQTTKLRTMVLALVDDVRVVLLKLAEQLVSLRHLKTADKSAQKKAALLVKHVYAPLANRLGIGHIKWQLEDWSFRYLNPHAYQQLKALVNMRRQERETYVNHMIKKIEQCLKEAGIEFFEVSGRAKHMYSIYKKIERKQVDFAEIYDAIALRILVDNIKACYSVLSVVHSLWEPIAKEFDDYISKPKPNGYRSIHTAVIGPGHRNVEIQIRTRAMHNESELGVAAHWAYKERQKSVAVIDDKINRLRQLLAWQSDLAVAKEAQAAECKKMPPLSIFADRVYVLTPKGDILDLPQKATPLDFAYYIHTQVGHRCRGAKVNGKLVALSSTLKTGDRIEILTDKQDHPHRDWLRPSYGYLTTKRALSKVAVWFRQHHDLEAKSTGQGDLPTIPLVKKIEEKEAKKASANSNQTLFVSKASKKNQVAQAATRIVVAGVDNLLTQMAQCCQPRFGDVIVGYCTKRRGITIHQTACAYITTIKHIHPYRLVAAHWGEKQHSATLNFIIQAQYHQELMPSITHIFSQEHARLVNITTKKKPAAGTVNIKVTFLVVHPDRLQTMIQQLKNLQGMMEVRRV